jgi:uncharacterized repeat protein (TIGR03803 family)
MAVQLGSDGNFYGCTQVGGLYGGGSLFQFTPAGAYQQLYSFPLVNGLSPSPFAGPAQHTGGLFYGVTDGGGARLTPRAA